MTDDTFAGAGRPLTREGLAVAATTLGCGTAEIWTVLGVETVGVGFLPDRRPLILFERHVFSDRTGGRFDNLLQDVSFPKPGGYGAPGANQYDRLKRAIALNRNAALESASWGIGQVMGYHARDLGYGSVAAMVAAMVESEDAQLQAMARFIANRPACRRALIAHEWATFARHYNGTGYARNRYDVRLDEMFRKIIVSGGPDLDVRAAQMYLTYRGHSPGPIDGIAGRRTEATLMAFQSEAGIPASGRVDQDTLHRLATAA